MIDPDGLTVWFEDRLVGFLWRDARGRIGFRYDDAWLTDGFRLSVRMPLRSDPFPPEAGAAHFFFANLLPEGRARERLIRTRRISDDDFTLLREFGGDCAGALSILPVEMEPSDTPEYAPLSEDELYKLILQRGRGAYARRTDAPQPRLSLAGAQDKCPVYLRNGRYALPTGTAPSSHILKFQIEGFANVPLYEAFMSRLATAIGLTTSETVLDTVRDQTFLVVSRFDRLWRNGYGTRLHQEDFLQALGAHAFQAKYEIEGGPGFADCARLVREHSEDPVTDLRALVRWQIFNVLAGNSDGHAKNLALVQAQHATNRWRLAPFYDLVCTRAIEHVDTHLAMSVGGEYQPERITREHWQVLARESGLPPRLMLDTLAETQERLAQAFDTTREAFEAQFGPVPALQRIRSVLHASGIAI